MNAVHLTGKYSWHYWMNSVRLIGSEGVKSWVSSVKVPKFNLSLFDSVEINLRCFLITDNYPLARKILMNIENNVPGLAMVCMRRISLERRKGNHEAAEELFRAYIQKAVSHKARTFFSIKYARYLQKVWESGGLGKQNYALGLFKWSSI